MDKTIETPQVDAAAEPVTPAAATVETAEEIAARERARIVAIQKLAIPGAEEIISAAIESGKSPEATALEILTSESVKAARALAARKADAAVVSGVEPEPVKTEDAEKEAQVGRIAQAGITALKFIRGGGVR